MAGSAGRCCYAYRVEHIDSGRYYYGIRTCRAAAGPDRDGYMGSGVAIRAMIAKHGVAAFRKTVLARFDSWDLACRYEAAIVTKSALADPLCLNLKTGGRNGLHSAETRARISAAKVGCRGPNLGRKFSDEVRRRMSDAHAGVSRRPCPPEVREKIAATQRGREVPQWKREAIRSALLGRKLSEEHKRNVSTAMIGQVRGPKSETTRARISASLTGRRLAPDHRAKMHEAILRGWATRRANIDSSKKKGG